jgi:sec-independent protein translocase protein TatA
MIYFISGAELVFVFFVILLVFGADKVPDIARTLGKGMRQVRNATQDIKSEIEKSAEKQGLDTKQIEQDLNEVKDEVENIAGSVKRNNYRFRVIVKPSLTGRIIVSTLASELIF